MRKQKISLVLLAVAIFGIMGTVAEAATVAETEIHTLLLTGVTKEIDFESWPAEQAVLFYWPREQGTRTIDVWHQLYFVPMERGVVSFYWKDMSVTNDQWHHFATKDFGLQYPYFNARTKLYSGSKYIAYEIRISHYYDYTMPVFVRAY